MKLYFLMNLKLTNMRILKEQTAGLIIDIQERLFHHIYDNEDLSTNTQILIKGLNVFNIPIIVTQQYTKGLGATIQPIDYTLQSKAHIEKTSFSCYDEPTFITELNNLNKKFVVIAGIETHVCVLQTSIDLLEKNYIPVIVEDCVSSRTLQNKKIAINRLQKEGAIITSYESVLFELCRYSGTPEFKAISKLVK